MSEPTKRKATPVTIDPEMVVRIERYITEKGRAKGRKNIADVVRTAVDVFLENDGY